MGKRLNRRCCVVCGKKAAGYTGYFFFESGRTALKAPFCEEHLVKASEFASPVFENETALVLFRAMHPVSFWQDVADKPILYFDSYKIASLN